MDHIVHGVAKSQTQLSDFNFLHADSLLLSRQGSPENSKKFLKKLKTELPYDPAIPFLGIYLKR